MASSGMIKTTHVVALIMCAVALAHLASNAEGAITCSETMTKVLPCLNYLRTGSSMSATCCDGVRSLDSMTRNTPNLQTACACLVQAAKSYGISNVYAKQLPGKCGVKLGFAFDVNTDCSK
ncbi:Non-specific lipid-transfer protein-like protein [Drosera capensis]